jgi:hypothetical protein
MASFSVFPCPLVVARVWSFARPRFFNFAMMMMTASQTVLGGQAFKSAEGGVYEL